ncbi:hypothetical protein SEA_XKCD426_63 [Streptomyces phage Xkcd426]|nr:hypothetical protein SEA_XKCD426_63 [Streptomyces phage Xkcd426]
MYTMPRKWWLTSYAVLFLFALAVAIVADELWPVILGYVPATLFTIFTDPEPKPVRVPTDVAPCDCARCSSVG